MDNENQNLPVTGGLLARQSYLASLNSNDSRHVFEAALLRLSIHAHVDVVRLFEGRLTWNQVRDYRRGRCRVPQWILTYLATMLEARASLDHAISSKCRSAHNVAPGQGSANNLGKWHARRAKEKAGG